MPSKLRVGVIGVGGIAKVHMPGWLGSDHTEVVAGSDINTPVLEQWGQQHGVRKLYANPDDLINDPDIDIVDICVPNNYHAPLSIAALNANKHVLCEKPLAPNPAQINAMIEARNRSGRLLMTAQHFRFSGSAKALKAEIDTGVLGDVYHARSWMLRRAAAPVTAGFIRKEHATGGACIDIGVHILDLTLWFMGNPKPVSVTGVARTELAHLPGAFSLPRKPIPSEMDVEEFAAAFVRFETGATLVLEVSWMLHHNAETVEDMQMWLYGTRGGSHWPKCEIYETNFATQQQYNRVLRITSDIRPPHAQECIEFAQAIVDGKDSPVPAEHSLQVLTILDGIYHSQQTGREVRFD